jgi:hypothetical protein
MTQPFDLEKYKAEQGRARDLGFDYAVIRNIILQANSDFEDRISVGKAIELIREIGLQAVDKAVAEERAAEDNLVRVLRRVLDENKLREAHGEDTLGVLMKCGAFHDTEVAALAARIDALEAAP